MSDTAKETPAAAPAAPARILVAEDAPEALALLVGLLKKKGHDVVGVEDGQLALRELRAGAFDLVLSDVMMPNLDGFGLLAAMKDDQTLRDIPSIIVSMLDDMPSMVKGIELGATDYLSKPVNRTMLKARVSAVLERKRLRDQERRSLEDLKIEQARSQRLLHSVLPPSMVKRLMGQAPGSGPIMIAADYPNAAVMFASIHNFAQVAAGRPAQETIQTLSTVFSLFDKLAEENGVTRIKTIGETYVAAAGIEESTGDAIERVADAALAMLVGVGGLKTSHPEPITLRIGMASGPVVGGVLGTSKVAFDLWGEPVTAAAHMDLLGLPGCIQVPGETVERIRDGYLLELRGTFFIAGLGEMETHLLRGRKSVQSLRSTAR